MIGTVLVAVAVLVASCREPEPVKSQEAGIVQLSITIGSEDKTITFNDKREATVTYAYRDSSNRPTKATIKSITLSKKATASVKTGEDVGFVDGKITIVVTAEDGSTKNTYTIVFTLVDESSKATQPGKPGLDLMVGKEASTEIALMLTPPTDTGLEDDGQTAARITGYRVEYAKNEQFTDPGEKNIVLSPTDTVRADTVQGLQSNTEYFVRAAAVNSAKLTGPYSAIKQLTTGKAPVSTAPGVPTITSLKAGANPANEIDVNIVLSDSTGTFEDGRVASVTRITVVYVEDNFANDAETIGVNVDNAIEMDATLSELLPGTPYFVYATVTNNAGMTSSHSDTLFFVTNADPSSLTLPGVISAGTIPSDPSGYEKMAQEVLSPYTGGAVVLAKYITERGNGSETGDSWGNAAPATKAKTILDNIVDAGANKIYLLLLAAGEYHLGEALSMKNHVAIVGGWGSKGLWTRNAADSTIFLGKNQHRLFNNSDLNNKAVLHSVTIKTGLSVGNGGGMFNKNSSPILIDVVFSENIAIGGSGGGMYNEKASPLLIHVVFEKNVARGEDSSGGGMYSTQNKNEERLIIRKSVFRNNIAGGSGGGIYNNNVAVTLDSVSFLENNAKSGGGIANSSSSLLDFKNLELTGNTAIIDAGGGIYNHASSPFVTNATITNNTAIKGGGVFNDGGSKPVIINAAFVGNTADDGGGIYNRQSSPSIANATFSGNTTTGNGGGVYNKKSSPVFANVTIANNRASGYGGGMFNDNDEKEGPVVVNSIFWNNSTPDKGKQIALFNQEKSETEKIVLAHSVIEGGTDSAALALEEHGESMNIVATSITTENPGLETLADNGGKVPTMKITNTSPAKDKGMYVGLHRSGDVQFNFYSNNGANWFRKITAVGLIEPVTLDVNDIKITDTDATGTKRTAPPDAGAYEARGE